MKSHTAVCAKLWDSGGGEQPCTITACTYTSPEGGRKARGDGKVTGYVKSLFKPLKVGCDVTAHNHLLSRLV